MKDFGCIAVRLGLGRHVTDATQIFSINCLFADLVSPVCSLPGFRRVFRRRRIFSVHLLSRPTDGVHKWQDVFVLKPGAVNL